MNISKTVFPALLLLGHMSGGLMENGRSFVQAVAHVGHMRLSNGQQSVPGISFAKHQVEGTPRLKTVPIVHPSEAETYTELFSSAIARFQVAAVTGGSAVWNAEGSRAMAELLLTTAEKFDRHVADLTSKLPSTPPATKRKS